MSLRIRNTGPGNDYILGILGVDEIVNLGGGADVIITGGRGRSGTGFVEVNSGVDFGTVDKVYSESLPGFGNAYVGGHEFYTLNGVRVARESHIYHLGAVRDESRITLVDRDGNIIDALVEGLFGIHGRGDFDMGPTRIKAWDSREGAQQISIAAESLDDIAVYRLKTEWLDGDEFRLDQFDLHGHHVSPILDDQNLRIDMLGVPPSMQVVLEAGGHTYADQREAVMDWLGTQVADHSLLLGM